jgi:hypothetical protein
VENASVADFGAEDGLFYVGYEEDLEKALKGVTLDEFLDREDVDYEFMDDEPEDFDDEENAFDGGGVTEEERASTFELAEGMVRICVAEVKRWCAEKGVRPAAELERAAKLHVASVLSVVASVGMGATEQEAKEGSHGLLQNLIRDQGGDVAPAIVAALAQIRACAATHPDHLINGALDRFDRSSPDTIDVPLEHALPTEPPCSTPATPSSPLSSSNTPVP